MKKLVHFINHTHKSTPPIDTASTMEIEVVSRGGATGEEREGMEEEEEEDESMDTMTLELVDQMEIEISEMEEETGEEESVGDNRVEEKTEVIEIKPPQGAVSLNLLTLTISLFLRKPLIVVDTLLLQWNKLTFLLYLFHVNSLMIQL